MWHWFLHYSGIDNPSGPWEAWWAGMGSDLGELTIVGALFVGLKHHRCHVEKCWRLGHPDQDGRVHCRKHLN